MTLDKLISELQALLSVVTYKLQKIYHPPTLPGPLHTECSSEHPRNVQQQNLGDQFPTSGFLVSTLGTDIHLTYQRG